MARDLDFAPLRERPRLRERWADIASNNGLVIGVVLAVLLLGVGVSGVVVRLSTGVEGSDDSIWIFGFLLVCGLALAVSLFWQTGHGAVLARFAQANDLESLRAAPAPHYAAQVFASGMHTVNDAVRTREELFVEVGERFPTGEPLNPRDPKNQMVYLRARLPGRAVPPVRVDDLATPELRTALTAWAGRWSVDVSDDELTLLGTKPLAARRSGRVEEGLRLVHALVARAEAVLELDTSPVVAVTTPSGVTVPPPEPVPETQPVRPLRVVLGVLAMLVVAPLGFALVMSLVESTTRGGGWAGGVVVYLLIGGLVAGVAAFMRWLLTPRTKDPYRSTTRA